MSPYLVFSILLLIFITSGTSTTVSSSSTPTTTTDRPTLGIIGGEKTRLGDFPSMVSLQYNNNNSLHFCGGTLIDREHVVTAAHCVFNSRDGQIPNSHVHVMAGDISVTQKDKSLTRVYRRVALIFAHEDFDIVSGQNDIAVLRLLHPIEQEPGAIDFMPVNSEYFDMDHVCKIAGWGYTSYDAEVSSDYQYSVNLTILSDWSCSLIYPRYYNSKKMICVGSWDVKKDTCKGDTGGGLICNNTLTGIASFGLKCQPRHLPTVYTNVSVYYDFIRECMEFSGDQDDIPQPRKGFAVQNNSISKILIIVIMFIYYY